MTSIQNTLESVRFVSPVLFLIIVPFVAFFAWQLLTEGRRASIELSDLEYLLLRNRISGAGRRNVRGLLWCIIVLLLAILWANPKYYASDHVYTPKLEQVTYRNFVVALDMSPSMNLPATYKGYGGDDLRHGDTGSTRYEVARQALLNFLDRFRGDRFGLILFSTEPFFARWPTFELENNFLEVLDDSIRRGSGTQLEAFSSLTNTDQALIKAHNVFAGKKGAIILISDAEDDIDNMVSAMQEVRNADIRLYIIGAGMSEETVATLSKAFENDPGFRIFGVDNAEEIQKAYILIGDVEETSEFTDGEIITEIDLRRIFSIFLILISIVTIWINEIILHQSSRSGRRSQHHGI